MLASPRLHTELCECVVTWSMVVPMQLVTALHTWGSGIHSMKNAQIFLGLDVRLLGKQLGSIC